MSSTRNLADTIAVMAWEKTTPGVWQSPKGFKILQCGRGRFVCSCREWEYETKTLEDAQSACRSMAISAWYLAGEAA